ncbi:ribosome silencing factor [Thiohalobacter sp. IOR34]|uniref:ribosome silencing factor n=1 Tax=Thiohalobacter sp. IOR34 TaxID=3057176 RepID=UPI0025AF4914|nr:ribosome silencing factor [Thiohalobacter sp. IOR34]WJW74878.1 ribosome silencing factor [Thiohalobacter sp. IOR34]
MTSHPDSEQLKALVVEALEALKAQDICVLEVGEFTSVADYMIIASGSSDRHVKALADNVVEKAKQAGVPPLGVEGEAGSEWVLVDLGDVIVHVMRPQTRAFYNLEKLWSMGGEEEVVPSGEGGA